MPGRTTKTSDDANGKTVPRKDGRRPLLVYMRPELIKSLKRIALESEVTVFSIVEEAADDWLKKNGNPRE